MEDDKDREQPQKDQVGDLVEKQDKEDRERTEIILAQRSHTPIIEHFLFMHLPPHLRSHSRPFANLASSLVDNMPGSAELTAGLRKLLESKDCVVRARLIQVREMNATQVKESD